jgi:hypothetical protein
MTGMFACCFGCNHVCRLQVLLSPAFPAGLSTKYSHCRPPAGAPTFLPASSRFLPACWSPATVYAPVIGNLLGKNIKVLKDGRWIREI